MYTEISNGEYQEALYGPSINAIYDREHELHTGSKRAIKTHASSNWDVISEKELTEIKKCLREISMQSYEEYKKNKAIYNPYSRGRMFRDFEYWTANHGVKGESKKHINVGTRDPELHGNDRGRKILEITKTKDDWYYIEFCKNEKIKDAHKLEIFWYKCDQLDGLIQFLKDNVYYC